jgi:hypothetical protein
LTNIASPAGAFGYRYPASQPSTFTLAESGRVGLRAGCSVKRWSGFAVFAASRDIHSGQLASREAAKPRSREEQAEGSVNSIVLFLPFLNMVDGVSTNTESQRGQSGKAKGVSPAN